MSIKETIIKNIQKLTTRKSNNSTRNNHHYNGKSKYDNLITSRENLRYNDYKELSKDYQISVGLETIEAFLLSKDYVLTSNSEDPTDVMITEFVRDMLDNMDTPFRQVRKNIYTAIKYGFSVQEKVYRVEDNKILISSIHPLHIKTLQHEPFVYDDKGNLIEIHQESDYGHVNLGMDKVILYSYKAEFDEVEGHSILNNLDNIARTKKKIIEWLVTYLHKHENPVLYAKVADGSASKLVSEMLDEVAEGKTNLTVSTEDELGTLETSHRGDAFFNALNYFDNIILRRMFIGNLLYGDNQQTGSYAQSQTQMQLTCSIFNGLHEDIAIVIQKELNKIVEWNFGKQAKAPRFSFEDFVEKDIIALLNALKPYIDNMTIDQEAPWLKEVISIAVQQISGVKVDKNTTNNPIDDGTDYSYQPPLPGSEEIEDIIEKSLTNIL